MGQEVKEPGAVGKWAGVDTPITSSDVSPVRCAALRNPGHGSRNLTRKAKPSVRVGRKATGLKGPIGV